MLCLPPSSPFARQSASYALFPHLPVGSDEQCVGPVPPAPHVRVVRDERHASDGPGKVGRFFPSSDKPGSSEDSARPVGPSNAWTPCTRASWAAALCHRGGTIRRGNGQKTWAMNSILLWAPVSLWRLHSRQGRRRGQGVGTPTRAHAQGEIPHWSTLA